MKIARYHVLRRDEQTTDTFPREQSIWLPTSLDDVGAGNTARFFDPKGISLDIDMIRHCRRLTVNIGKENWKFKL